MDEEQLLFIGGGQDDVVDEDVDEQPVQDLALNVDNVFQADDCDAFDSDVDEAPIAQTMFMENLSSADPVYDEASPSYDSNILSEVPDHDNYQDVVCEHHEVHEMHNVVQPNYVVDSHTSHASDSNMISYDQYVKDNAVPVVQSNVSSVPNDAYMMIINEMHEQTAQSVSANKQNKKENKYLEEFLDMKALKEKVEDKLYKQDQSLQTVHMLCKPKPYYDEQKKVAIGYKNPLCLTRAKQVQPALYNGHEIIKTNHVPAIVHNSEDTLEIAEITREKMNDKMKFPIWTEHNINIRPPDYSKENYLATFTPQTQLTPSQIFWSKDVLKMKAEALKEQTPASRPIKALTVYPPNTPAALIPRVLSTKSQVKINIFALIQLFSEFKKTCKKRITLMGLTKGERGFEQTKECYLTEVIPFFKTLKEHFEGIQKALTKEVKEMKENFEEFEAEVDQNVVNRKSVYLATNSELTVSRFTEMHDAHTVVQARCLELEAELSKLHDKVQKDDHTELVKHFSNLEAQIKDKMKCVTMDSVKPKFLAPGMYAVDVELIPLRYRNNREVHLDYLTHLKESVETLREIVEEARLERPLDRSLVSACLYTKQSQELLEYAIGTSSNNNTQNHVEQLNIQKTNVHVIPSTGINTCTNASRSQPRSNTKKNRILRANSDNKKQVEEHPRTNKSSRQKSICVNSSISSKRAVINLNSHSVCKTCNKCFIFANHDMCVVNYLTSVNASPSVKNVVNNVKKVWQPKQVKQVKQVWKATGKMLTNVGYQWKPTGRKFTLGE
ncbi:hypothetical protein Tco_0807070 [Tanacetum coccineum]